MFGWEGVTEFVAVAETESFTAASQRLGISTAQVSRQISALEKRLATKLFYRTTRRVSVTEEGKVYYQHCRQLLDGLDEAERALSQLQSRPQGKLKLTAPTTFGETKIIPLLNDFMLQYPELEVECHLSNQRVALVEEGYDLAIRLGKLADSSMIAKRLGARQQFICASKDYLNAHGRPDSISELEQHNCLQGTLDYWRLLDQGQEREVRIKGSLRCNSGLALLDAALKGIGIVQLPDYYVKEHIEQGKLVPLLEGYQPEPEGIWALYPHNRHLSPKVRMLVEYLGERMGS
ncbi:LysR substrate-binding domain-containing protein [Neptuniibacter sp. QD72_48]|uniref:LysR substrate-binding domain-containing protein n=1 Tax=Neptuniibacter sp. QD72_48 TaxID=3398214 RepID=UPI0039F5E644